MQLEMGLSQLNCKQDCDELCFWGKINGLKNDYYIAMGLNFRGNYEFPTKSFFWALSTDFEFRGMPSLNSAHDEKINADTTYFTGEPARVIFSVQKPEGEEGEEEPPMEMEDEEDPDKPKAANSDESEEEEIKVPERDFTGKPLDCSWSCRVGQTYIGCLRY